VTLSRNIPPTPETTPLKSLNPQIPCEISHIHIYTLTYYIHPYNITATCLHPSIIPQKRIGEAQQIPVNSTQFDRHSTLYTVELQDDEPNQTEEEKEKGRALGRAKAKKKKNKSDKHTHTHTQTKLFDWEIRRRFSRSFTAGCISYLSTRLFSISSHRIVFYRIVSCRIVSQGFLPLARYASKQGRASITNMLSHFIAWIARIASKYRTISHRMAAYGIVLQRISWPGKYCFLTCPSLFLFLALALFFPAWG
jgi:hypothetical protein